MDEENSNEDVDNEESEGIDLDNVFRYHTVNAVELIKNFSTSPKEYISKLHEVLIQIDEIVRTQEESDSSNYEEWRNHYSIYTMLFYSQLIFEIIKQDIQDIKLIAMVLLYSTPFWNKINLNNMNLGELIKQEDLGSSSVSLKRKNWLFKATFNGRNEGGESFTPLESCVSFNREDVALEMIETAKKHNQELRLLNCSTPDDEYLHKIIYRLRKDSSKLLYMEIVELLKHMHSKRIVRKETILICLLQSYTEPIPENKNEDDK